MPRSTLHSSALSDEVSLSQLPGVLFAYTLAGSVFSWISAAASGLPK